MGALASCTHYVPYSAHPLSNVHPPYTPTVFPCPIYTLCTLPHAPTRHHLPIGYPYPVHRSTTHSQYIHTLHPSYKAIPFAQPISLHRYPCLPTGIPTLCIRGYSCSIPPPLDIPAPCTQLKAPCSFNYSLFHKVFWTIKRIKNGANCPVADPRMRRRYLGSQWGHFHLSKLWKSLLAFASQSPSEFVTSLLNISINRISQ